MQKELKRLSEITNLFGPSGFEEEVASYLLNEYKRLGYETKRDPFGNVYAIKKSKNPNARKVLLAGHMDEVGFMVRKILPNGSFMVNPLGGFNPETILACRAILKVNNGNKYYGAVQSVPPHLLKGSNNDSKTPISMMIFDFGFASKNEAEEAGVEVGNPIILEGNFAKLSEKRMLAKAFDDRYGIALGLEMLEKFKDVDLDYDLIVAGLCQEEVGLRGSMCAASFIKPDIAIVMDVSAAMDTDGSTSEFGQLGKGVLVRVLDSNMVARPELLEIQKCALRKVNVPFQYFISPGGTDAGSIHKSLAGIPTMTYCLVARSIHTCSSILDIDDYLNSIKGLESILLTLNNDKIKSVCYLTY